MAESNQRIEVMGNYGATLSLIELGLGSFLHALKFPLTGLLLSLNQGYLLCRIAIRTEDKTIAYAVSNIAAILKSLSPAGNKLGPMLSLSMQGFLFSIGLLFGVNPIGLSFGMVLLSLWSFIQPLITYYVFFGENLFIALDFVFEKTMPFHGIRKENLLWLMGGIILLKALMAVTLALLAWRTNGDDNLQDRLANLAHKKEVQIGPPALLALKDLMKPVFLLSLFATGFFLSFSQHPWSKIIWYLMRPVAVGFFFFYLSRTLMLDRWLQRLGGTRLKSFAKGCELALGNIRKVL
jgi:hypothetical protein